MKMYRKDGKEVTAEASQVEAMVKAGYLLQNPSLAVAPEKKEKTKEVAKGETEVLSEDDEELFSGEDEDNGMGDEVETEVEKPKAVKVQRKTKAGKN
jgi:uncharacterized protein YdaT